MEIRGKYLAVAFLLVLTTITLITKEETIEGRAFAQSFIESNTVILRLYYPFTDAGGPGSAVVYAVSVSVFKRKTVVLQIIEENRCIRTSFDGRTPSPDESIIPINGCLSEAHPTIEIQESPNNSIIQTKNITKIRGRAEDIPHMLRQIILEIYPDADNVIEQTNKVIESLH